jgi:hypothetical protein
VRRRARRGEGPARCFIYTSEEALDSAVSTGVVTPGDARSLREFAEFLRGRAVLARQQREEPYVERLGELDD